MESQIVAKGTFSGGKLVMQEARGQKDETTIARIVTDVEARVPSFVSDASGKPRTMLFEDIDGYTFIKFFPAQDDIRAVLIRISGVIYSAQEIRKISVQLAQYVDVNLALDTLAANTSALMASTSATDFSRPVRSQLGVAAWLTDEDRGKRLEELLPVINRARHASTMADRIMFTKLELLARQKERKGSADDPHIVSTVDGLLVALDAASDADISPLDKGIVLYNMALVLRELGHLANSSRLFQGAARSFDACSAPQLAVFARFNEAINAKQSGNLSSAFQGITALRPVVQSATFLPDSFKGIFFRYDGEMSQAMKDLGTARTAYTSAISYFERAHQMSFDAALCYFARGMLDFGDEAFFDACKNFTFATNILGLLGQDTSKVSRNLGISYFNLAREYAVAIKVLDIERDARRAVDMLLKGLGFVFLAHFYAGTEITEKVKEVIVTYSNLCEKEAREDLPPNDREVASQLHAIAREYASTLGPAGADPRAKAKDMFERIRSFQPLKVYFLLVIFKGNGLSVYSKESKALTTVPKMDENLIAGMISGITSFLTEVLSGEQQLSLLDRDNIKILFEYSKNLMGIVFANKENPKLRQELKDVLETTEREARDGLERWTGDVTKFSFIGKLAAKFIE